MPNASKRRLVVRCNGGLGNQIFQYAAGLFFAERLSAQLEILSPLNTAGEPQSKGFARPFQLDKFSLTEKIRSVRPVDRFHLSTKPALRGLHHALRSVTMTESIEEPSTNRFLPTLLDREQARTIYLTGYWQAAEYAEAVADKLRDSLQQQNQLHAQNEAYAEAISTLKHAVSVHIRVGDFALHTATDSKSGGQATWVLRKSYYREAISRIRAMLPKAELVVFSDDPLGAESMMDGEAVSLWVKGNSPATAYEELWLMSRCKHHVIANSSFSWWGAWMNPTPEKIVLAPRYWFNTQDSYYPELFPSNWIAIDNLT